MLLRHNPDMPVTAAGVLAAARLRRPGRLRAFYPSPASAPDDRRRAAAAGRSPTRACGGQRRRPAAGDGRSHRLGPARAARPPHPPHRHRGGPRACAALAARLLHRGAIAYSEAHARRAPGHAGPHRDRHRPPRPGRRSAPRLLRADPGLAGITVDTANRLQGREFDVTIVLHPLSGRRDATAFHLEAGRLCVLTSRHRHACIVVARAGIAELLDAHPSTEPVHLNVPRQVPRRLGGQPGRALTLGPVQGACGMANRPSWPAGMTSHIRCITSSPNRGCRAYEGIEMTSFEAFFHGDRAVAVHVPGAAGP